MSIFNFKYFTIQQVHAAMKVGTDSMLLGAFAEVENQNEVLDIGAGTGVLSLMQAQKATNLSILAIEFDEEALKDLVVNFQNSPFNSNFTILAKDFNTVKLDQQFDVIISNPPFYKGSFTVGEKGSRSKARNEENLSFVTLLTRSKVLLKPEGKFWFIFPYAAYNQLEKLISDNQFFIKKEILIYGKSNVLTRVILCLSLMKSEESEKCSLTVRNSLGEYTLEYIELTKDFHSKYLSQTKKG